MKVKLILLLTILISLACILYGCNNSKLSQPSSKENNTVKSEITSETSKPIDAIDLTFKSKLGFEMKFPSNWKDKYTIKENNDSVSVYFKSIDPKTPPNSGLLFVIMKNNDSLNKDMYDSIDGNKYLTIGNTTYFIGSPTDVALNPENTDFNTFLSMNKERKKVIDTIKSSN
ncbi:hypothetical protein JOC70_002483 [Clostridium pascui]|uniref:hypothetical protein n=1 Tax=Clostridium pascui TaxID=46609 RepID=UPI00195A527B|nr:hypothetical protein [Clostridium pascui]MBM7870989.1 hypothetical protein [Clostridium pascui]